MARTRPSPVIITKPGLVLRGDSPFVYQRPKVPLSNPLKAGLHRDEEPKGLALLNELGCRRLDDPFREGLRLDLELREQPGLNADLLRSALVRFRDPTLLDHQTKNKPCSLMSPFFRALLERVKSRRSLDHSGQQS